MEKKSEGTRDIIMDSQLKTRPKALVECPKAEKSYLNRTMGFVMSMIKVRRADGQTTRAAEMVVSLVRATAVEVDGSLRT